MAERPLERCRRRFLHRTHVIVELPGLRIISSWEGKAMSNRVRKLALIGMARGFACLAASAVPFVGLASADHYSYSVTGPVQTFAMTAGETQSTVVAPALKAQCPKGRFLVTNDLVRPPQVGTVLGRDLNYPGTPDLKSTFDPVPDSTNYFFGTNDHDIVTLSTGDVLLVWGVHSKAPLNPKPAWFDYTYKSTFGPGTRRGMMVWRSTDCGQTFQYLSQIDPATVGDGSCALPQPGTTPGGPPYSNGGPDGQLVKVDLSNDNVYVTMPCEGRKQDLTKPGFVLSNSEVNETFVLRSTNKGATWDNLGTLPVKAWRFGIAPLNSGKLAIARYNALSFGIKLANGTYQLPTTEQSASVAWGYVDYLTHPAGVPVSVKFSTTPQVTAKIICTNFWAVTIVSRVPDSDNVLIAYPATLTDSNGKKSYGYQLYFYDRIANQFSQATPIFPAVHSPDNALMHLAAIDPGTGPVLLYWYDINADTKKATVRGRLIFADKQYSDDIVVATDAPNTTHVFDLITMPKGCPDGKGGYVGGYWFGDYKTAGGFAPHGFSARDQVYRYYPMWDEPDGTVRFSEVVVHKVKERVGRLGADFKKLNIVVAAKPKIGPPPVELHKRILTDAELRFLETRDVGNGNAE
jgi:hypothetical protein